ncbi:MAG: hypothetical protein JWN27_947 [Candidatus Eremiobacteraeota bacterium]|nr:hypothetical protein [Candidatus Eremiobacteraeota bacterium]
MTDESLFYRSFIEDIRRCAAGRAPSRVAELERRIHAALSAPSERREGLWARVVGGVSELLCTFGDRGIAAARLRAFLRENADLDRPRDVALTDFTFVGKPAGVLHARGGHRYLLFAPIPRAAPDAAASVLDEVVPAPTRRLAEWTVYGLCGGAAAAAMWFAFIVPV